jgi:hypothetical protein
MALSRKKRDIFYFKQRELIERFKAEYDRLIMLLSDGNAALARYHLTKWGVYRSETTFIINYEDCLNTHLNKRYLRLTGYPKTLVGDLHDRDSKEEGDKTADYLWNLQQRIMSILSGKQYSDIRPIEVPNSPCAILTVLQLGEVIFSKDVNRVESRTQLSDQYHLICVQVLYDLYDFFSEASIPRNKKLGWVISDLPHLLVQCMRTLRVVLMMDEGFLKHLNTNSSDIFKQDERLCNIFSRWVEIISSIRAGGADLYSRSSLRELIQHVSPSTTLIADLFVCCKCSLQIILAHSRGKSVKRIDTHAGDSTPTGYQALSDHLIRSVSPCGLLILEQCLPYGQAPRRASIGDTRMIESLQAEISAYLSFVAAAFSAGSLQPGQLKSLQLALTLSISFRHCMFFQSAWFHAVLSAILCLNLTLQSNVESEKDIAAKIVAAKMAEMKVRISSGGDSSQPPSTLPLKDQLYVFLGSCIQEIVRSLGCHLFCPSIQQTGLLIVRLLLRSPYMSKRDIDIFLEGDQNANRELKEEAKAIKLARKLKSTSEQGGRAIFSGVVIGDSPDSVPDAPPVTTDNDDDVSIDSITDWKEDNFDNDDQLIAGNEDQFMGVPHTLSKEDGLTQEMTLCELLVHSGENNMQSDEVIEQWLLLIYQLGVGSPLSTQSLVNAYVDGSVQKVLSIQTNNVYLIALCELCLHLIRTHDSEFDSGY